MAETNKQIWNQWSSRSLKVKKSWGKTRFLVQSWHVKLCQHLCYKTQRWLWLCQINTNITYWHENGFQNQRSFYHKYNQHDAFKHLQYLYLLYRHLREYSRYSWLPTAVRMKLSLSQMEVIIFKKYFVPEIGLLHLINTTFRTSLRVLSLYLNFLRRHFLMKTTFNLIGYFDIIDQSENTSTVFLKSNVGHARQFLLGIGIRLYYRP